MKLQWFIERGWRIIVAAIVTLSAIGWCMAQLGFQIVIPLLLVGALPVFALGFIVLDLVMFGVKKESSPPHAKDKLEFKPNLQIWGLGMLLGTGMTFIYFLGAVIVTLLNRIPTTIFELLQNITLLLLLGASLGFIVWAVVKICQPL